ncbi:plasmid replication protein RepB [Photobacterium phosphoreum]|uniref:plasmid replication protein RepB n=1 Tax=Photobacterium phosphoreum TaxID=659 RepID=UPI000D176424|nr:plasmid replication protein RepB [Photobacterium phosphoreum]PSU80698.1 plasmid replication protein RepB [Photobacterium phosphoreum]PSW33456.1 plasmid replication protein RepB [Photobacterium phosphoreum]
MEIKEAKLHFDAGQLREAKVINAAMEQGYNLYLIGKRVSDNVFVTAQRSGDNPRVFKTIDAACRNAKEIGFRTIEVTYE